MGYKRAVRVLENVLKYFKGDKEIERKGLIESIEEEIDVFYNRREEVSRSG